MGKVEYEKVDEIKNIKGVKKTLDTMQYFV